ncbi:uncharacterized protein LOC120327732 isoform X2 [Styela clava]
MVSENIDLSYLTVEERTTILKVLNRDEKIRETEEKRVKILRRKSVNFDKKQLTFLKIFTGEWIKEVATRGKNFTLAASGLVRTHLLTTTETVTTAPLEIIETTTDINKEKINTTIQEQSINRPKDTSVVVTIDVKGNDVKITSKVDTTAPQTSQIENLAQEKQQISFDEHIEKKQIADKSFSESEEKGSPSANDPKETSEISKESETPPENHSNEEDDDKEGKSKIAEWFSDTFSSWNIGKDKKDDDPDEEANEETIVPTNVSNENVPKSVGGDEKETKDKFENFADLISTEFDSTFARLDETVDKITIKDYAENEPEVVPVIVPSEEYQPDLFGRLLAQQTDYTHTTAKQEHMQYEKTPNKMSHLGDEFNDADVDICRSLESITDEPCEINLSDLRSGDTVETEEIVLYAATNEISATTTPFLDVHISNVIETQQTISAENLILSTDQAEADINSPIKSDNGTFSFESKNTEWVEDISTFEHVTETNSANVLENADLANADSIFSSDGHNVQTTPYLPIPLYTDNLAPTGSVSDDGSYGDDPLSLVEFLDSIPSTDQSEVKFENKFGFEKQLSIDEITSSQSVLNVVEDLLHNVEKLQFESELADEILTEDNGSQLTNLFIKDEADDDNISIPVKEISEKMSSDSGDVHAVSNVIVHPSEQAGEIIQSQTTNTYNVISDSALNLAVSPSSAENKIAAQSKDLTLDESTEQTIDITDVAQVQEASTSANVNVSAEQTTVIQCDDDGNDLSSEYDNTTAYNTFPQFAIRSDVDTSEQKKIEIYSQKSNVKDIPQNYFHDDNTDSVLHKEHDPEPSYAPEDYIDSTEKILEKQIDITNIEASAISEQSPQGSVEIPLLTTEESSSLVITGETILDQDIEDSSSTIPSESNSPDMPTYMKFTEFSDITIPDTDYNAGFKPLCEAIEEEDETQIEESPIQPKIPTISISDYDEEKYREYSEQFDSDDSELYISEGNDYEQYFYDQQYHVDDDDTIPQYSDPNNGGFESHPDEEVILEESYDYGASETSSHTITDVHDATGEVKDMITNYETPGNHDSDMRMKSESDEALTSTKKIEIPGSGHRTEVESDISYDLPFVNNNTGILDAQSDDHNIVIDSETLDITLTNDDVTLTPISHDTLYNDTGLVEPNVSEISEGTNDDMVISTEIIDKATSIITDAMSKAMESFLDADRNAGVHKDSGDIAPSDGSYQVVTMSLNNENTNTLDIANSEEIGRPGNDFKSTNESSDLEVVGGDIPSSIPFEIPEDISDLKEIDILTKSENTNEVQKYTDHFTLDDETGKQRDGSMTENIYSPSHRQIELIQQLGAELVETVTEAIEALSAEESSDELADDKPTDKTLSTATDKFVNERKESQSPPKSKEIYMEKIPIARESESANDLDVENKRNDISYIEDENQSVSENSKPLDETIDDEAETSAMPISTAVVLDDIAAKIVLEAIMESPPIGTIPDTTDSTEYSNEGNTSETQELHDVQADDQTVSHVSKETIPSSIYEDTKPNKDNSDIPVTMLSSSEDVYPLSSVNTQETTEDYHKPKSGDSVTMKEKKSVKKIKSIKIKKSGQSIKRSKISTDADIQTTTSSEDLSNTERKSRASTKRKVIKKKTDVAGKISKVKSNENKEGHDIEAVQNLEEIQESIGESQPAESSNSASVDALGESHMEEKPNDVEKQSLNLAGDIDPDIQNSARALESDEMLSLGDILLELRINSLSDKTRTVSDPIRICDSPELRNKVTQAETSVLGTMAEDDGSAHVAPETGINTEMGERKETDGMLAFSGETYDLQQETIEDTAAELQSNTLHDATSEKDSDEISASKSIESDEVTFISDTEGSLPVLQKTETKKEEDINKHDIDNEFVAQDAENVERNETEHEMFHMQSIPEEPDSQDENAAASIPQDLQYSEHPVLAPIKEEEADEIYKSEYSDASSSITEITKDTILSVTSVNLENEPSSHIDSADRDTLHSAINMRELIDDEDDKLSLFDILAELNYEANPMTGDLQDTENPIFLSQTEEKSGERKVWYSEEKSTHLSAEEKDTTSVVSEYDNDITSQKLHIAEQEEIKFAPQDVNVNTTHDGSDDIIKSPLSTMCEGEIDGTSQRLEEDIPLVEKVDDFTGNVTDISQSIHKDTRGVEENTAYQESMGFDYDAVLSAELNTQANDGEISNLAATKNLDSTNANMEQNTDFEKTEPIISAGYQQELVKGVETNLKMGTVSLENETANLTHTETYGSNGAEKNFVKDFKNSDENISINEEVEETVVESSFTPVGIDINETHENADTLSTDYSSSDRKHGERVEIDTTLPEVLPIEHEHEDDVHAQDSSNEEGIYGNETINNENKNNDGLKAASTENVNQDLALSVEEAVENITGHAEEDSSKNHVHVKNVDIDTTFSEESSLKDRDLQAYLSSKEEHASGEQEPNVVIIMKTEMLLDSTKEPNLEKGNVDLEKENGSLERVDLDKNSNVNANQNLHEDIQISTENIIPLKITKETKDEDDFTKLSVINQSTSENIVTQSMLYSSNDQNDREHRDVDTADSSNEQIQVEHIEIEANVSQELPIELQHDTGMQTQFGSNEDRISAGEETVVAQNIKTETTTDTTKSERKSKKVVKKIKKPSEDNKKSESSIKKVSVRRKVVKKPNVAIKLTDADQGVTEIDVPGDVPNQQELANVTEPDLAKKPVDMDNEIENKTHVELETYNTEQEKSLSDEVIKDKELIKDGEADLEMSSVDLNNVTDNKTHDQLQTYRTDDVNQNLGQDFNISEESAAPQDVKDEAKFDDNSTITTVVNDESNGTVTAYSLGESSNDLMQVEQDKTDTKVFEELPINSQDDTDLQAQFGSNEDSISAGEETAVAQNIETETTIDTTKSERKSKKVVKKIKKPSEDNKNSESPIKKVSVRSKVVKKPNVANKLTEEKVDKTYNEKDADHEETEIVVPDDVPNQQELANVTEPDLMIKPVDMNNEIENRTHAELETYNTENTIQEKPLSDEIIKDKELMKDAEADLKMSSVDLNNVTDNKTHDQLQTYRTDDVNQNLGQDFNILEESAAPQDVKDETKFDDNSTITTVVNDESHENVTTYSLGESSNDLMQVEQDKADTKVSEELPINPQDDTDLQAQFGSNEDRISAGEDTAAAQNIENETTIDTTKSERKSKKVVKKIKKPSEDNKKLESSIKKVSVRRKVVKKPNVANKMTEDNVDKTYNEKDADQEETEIVVPDDVPNQQELANVTEPDLAIKLVDMDNEIENKTHVELETFNTDNTDQEKPLLGEVTKDKELIKDAEADLKMSSVDLNNVTDNKANDQLQTYRTDDFNQNVGQDFNISEESAAPQDEKDETKIHDNSTVATVVNDESNENVTAYSIGESSNEQMQVEPIEVDAKVSDELPKEPQDNTDLQAQFGSDEDCISAGEETATAQNIKTETTIDTTKSKRKSKKVVKKIKKPSEENKKLDSPIKKVSVRRKVVKKPNVANKLTEDEIDKTYNEKDADQKETEIVVPDDVPNQQELTNVTEPDLAIKPVDMDNEIENKTHVELETYNTEQEKSLSDEVIKDKELIKDEEADLEMSSVDLNNVTDNKTHDQLQTYRTDDVNQNLGQDLIISEESAAPQDVKDEAKFDDNSTITTVVNDESNGTVTASSLGESSNDLMQVEQDKTDTKVFEELPINSQDDTDLQAQFGSNEDSISAGEETAVAQNIETETTIDTTKSERKSKKVVKKIKKPSEDNKKSESPIKKVSVRRKVVKKPNVANKLTEEKVDKTYNEKDADHEETEIVVPDDVPNQQEVANVTEPDLMIKPVDMDNEIENRTHAELETYNTENTIQEKPLSDEIIKDKELMKDAEADLKMSSVDLNNVTDNKTHDQLRTYRTDDVNQNLGQDFNILEESAAPQDVKDETKFDDNSTITTVVNDESNENVTTYSLGESSNDLMQVEQDKADTKVFEELPINPQDDTDLQAQFGSNEDRISAGEDTAVAQNIENETTIDTTKSERKSKKVVKKIKKPSEDNKKLESSIKKVSVRRKVVKKPNVANKMTEDNVDKTYNEKDADQEETEIVVPDDVPNQQELANVTEPDLAIKLVDMDNEIENKTHVELETFNTDNTDQEKPLSGEVTKDKELIKDAKADLKMSSVHLNNATDNKANDQLQRYRTDDFYQNVGQVFNISEESAAPQDETKIHDSSTVATVVNDESNENVTAYSIGESSNEQMQVEPIEVDAKVSDELPEEPQDNTDLQAQFGSDEDCISAGEETATAQNIKTETTIDTTKSKRKSKKVVKKIKKPSEENKKSDSPIKKVSVRRKVVKKPNVANKLTEDEIDKTYNEKDADQKETEIVVPDDVPNQQELTNVTEPDLAIKPVDMDNEIENKTHVELETYNTDNTDQEKPLSDEVTKDKEVIKDAEDDLKMSPVDLNNVTDNKAHDQLQTYRTGDLNENLGQDFNISKETGAPQDVKNETKIDYNSPVTTVVNDESNENLTAYSIGESIKDRMQVEHIEIDAKVSEELPIEPQDDTNLQARFGSDEDRISAGEETAVAQNIKNETTIDITKSERKSKKVVKKIKKPSEDNKNMDSPVKKVSVRRKVVKKPNVAIKLGEDEVVKSNKKQGGDGEEAKNIISDEAQNQHKLINVAEINLEMQSVDTDNEIENKTHIEPETYYTDNVILNLSQDLQNPQKYALLGEVIDEPKTKDRLTETAATMVETSDNVTAQIMEVTSSNQMHVENDTIGSGELAIKLQDDKDVLTQVVSAEERTGDEQEIADANNIESEANIDTTKSGRKSRKVVKKIKKPLEGDKKSDSPHKKISVRRKATKKQGDEVKIAEDEVATGNAENQDDQENSETTISDKVQNHEELNKDAGTGLKNAFVDVDNATDNKAFDQLQTYLTGDDNQNLVQDSDITKKYAVPQDATGGTEIDDNSTITIVTANENVIAYSTNDSSNDQMQVEQIKFDAIVSEEFPMELQGDMDVKAQIVSTAEDRVGGVQETAVTEGINKETTIEIIKPDRKSKKVVKKIKKPMNNDNKSDNPPKKISIRRKIIKKPKDTEDPSEDVSDIIGTEQQTIDETEKMAHTDIQTPQHELLKVSEGNLQIDASDLTTDNENKIDIDQQEHKRDDQNNHDDFPMSPEHVLPDEVPDDKNVVMNRTQNLDKEEQETNQSSNLKADLPDGEEDIVAANESLPETLNLESTANELQATDVHINLTEKSDNLELDGTDLDPLATAQLHDAHSTKKIVKKTKTLSTAGESLKKPSIRRKVIKKKEKSNKEVSQDGEIETSKENPKGSSGNKEGEYLMEEIDSGTKASVPVATSCNLTLETTSSNLTMTEDGGDIAEAKPSKKSIKVLKKSVKKDLDEKDSNKDDSPTPKKSSTRRKVVKRTK